MRIHLIQNVRMPSLRLLSAGVIASAAVCIAAPLPANAELSAIDRDAYCKEELAYCGTITFENGGGYVVTDVRLKGAAAETEPRILSAGQAPPVNPSTFHTRVTFPLAMPSLSYCRRLAPTRPISNWPLLPTWPET